MIVDTSALMAIILGEAGFEDLDEVIVRSKHARISAGSFLECSVVLDRRLPPAQRQRLDALRAAYTLEIVPVTATQADLGRQAHERFGPGSGSAARLNFGDCFAYALAAETGEPLLFVGDDFTHTDITPALS